MENLFSVKGKIALVTGGSRGIGRMIAEGLTLNGVKVFIVSRKKEDCISAAKDIANKSEGECYPIIADLSKLEEIEFVVNKFLSKESHLDFLINNAGASWGSPVEEFTEFGWNKVMDLNLKSMFFITQKFIPILKINASNNEPSRVINIGSIDGIINSQFENISYSVSKAGVHHLTKILAKSLVHKNINVNGIAPGPFPSWMLSTGVGMKGKVKGVDWSIVSKKVPRSRIGSIEDIVGTTIYLCSRAGSYVVGETIVCDGGLVACS
ncbi:MAG: 3-oxoacyl-ACP reductase [Rhodospirillaceae bacterium]|nr:3-oxoacyl-ACP reductase [Rhodospirillaceae bacterium]|tara:strand:- start:61 stop:858 length:798 start_codon:yes stop_codon:yes gene_type:complete